MGWTNEQENAIKVRGAQTLITAAAGSGKTSVLTERVKNILCDTAEPCLANELLVVTFTRAAAGEMKERIEAALKKELKATGSAYIKRQLKLLPTADICTIDSFCSKTVRENFHLAGVSSDFSVLDEADEKDLLKKKTEEITEELYEENSDSFKVLNGLFLTERDDSVLSENILALYRYSRAYPDPEAWLEKTAEEFNPDSPLEGSRWAQIILGHYERVFSLHSKKLKKAVEFAQKDGNINDGYVDKLSLAKNSADVLSLLAENRTWDEFLKALYETSFSSERLNARKASENVKSFVKNAFDGFKKDVEGFGEKHPPFSWEHKEDCEKLYPVVKKLVSSVKLLTKRVDEEKKRLNKYSFDDICHMCIKLLVFPDGDTFKRTPLADALCEKYKEILIDEYQDTNAAQDIIFKAVSRNSENLYCVGDVKQSIYGFRLASPELFTAQKKALPDYCGETAPSKIALNANFRSRKGVTEAVNFVFSKIMSEEVGGIAYDESERLNYGAMCYEEKEDADCELFLLDVPTLGSAKAVEYEAKKIALYIKAAVLRGDRIYDKEEKTERACKYGDFCILSRSAKSKAEIYCNALQSVGVPSFSENDAPVENAKEATVLISLLRAVCNPLLDIPLASVLMSPLFGFTPDEMAEMRLLKRNGELYFSLIEYAKENEKAAAFLKKLELYRNVAATYPMDEFVKFVVDDTAINDIYLSLPDGAQRAASVSGIISAATTFTDNKRTGLFAFIRYLDVLSENKALKRISASGDTKNAVRVMSIHKSKGLEFPIVIIANLFKQYNFKDIRSSMMVSKEAGIGLKLRDDEKFTSYETVSSIASETALKNSIVSEELRILYVAMTRARDRLVMFCTNTNDAIYKMVSELLMSSGNESTLPIDPVYVLKCPSYAALIVSCFAFHSDADGLRALCSWNTYHQDDSGFRFKFEHSVYDENAPEENENEEALAECDGEFLLKVKESAEFVYPYEALSGVLAKRTASSLESAVMRREFFATETPSFAGDTLSGAVRGTAVHKFLELCDFKNAYDDTEKETARLVASGRLTQKEAEAVDIDAVSAFLSSPVGKRLLSADRVFKEYEFSVLRNAGDIYEGLPEEMRSESIVLEGKLDCAFVKGDSGVIIDYKTDNVSDEQKLVNMYKNQLEIYKTAFSECEGVSIDEVYLYSFKLKKFIEIR